MRLIQGLCLCSGTAGHRHRGGRPDGGSHHDIARLDSLDARTALNADGWSLQVERLPDPSRPDLLARVTLGHSVPPDPVSQRMAAAITRRRTDRRSFGDRTVPEAELTKLRRFVECEGAYLHVVRPDQTAMLAIGSACPRPPRSGPRHLLCGLLADVGEPYLVVRLGYRPDHEPLPAAPRRDPRDVITVDE